MNTPRRPGPYDPLQDADPDAPFFPLMATDPLAPPLVLEWADRARRHARTLDDEKEMQRLGEKALEAEHIAWAMQRYYKTGSAEEVRARPARATYSGETGDVDEYALRELLAHGTTSLREADYYACEARDALHKLGKLTAEEATALQEVMETLKRIADAHEPKRLPTVEEPKLPLPAAAGEAA